MRIVIIVLFHVVESELKFSLTGCNMSGTALRALLTLPAVLKELKAMWEREIRVLSSL